MKIKKILFILFIFFLIAGCGDYFMICSLNPFYIEKNITLEDEIEGSWIAKVIPAVDIPENDNHIAATWGKLDTLCEWKIKRFAAIINYRAKNGSDSIGYNMPENYYRVEMVQTVADTAIYKFILVLFKINNVLYGDFIPEANTIFQNSLFASSNFFRVHTLARITVKNGGLDISFLGDDTMKQMISERRVRIKFKWVEETSRLLLTASSAELTAMIERYGTEKRFIDWDTQSTMLKLTPSKTVQP